MTQQKRKVIILEGVDKTGKSTMAEKLLKATPCSILIKHNRRELDNIKQVFTDMCLILRNIPGNAPIILDRFYPSQMVYSILRGKEDLHNIFYKVLEQDMLAHPTLKFEIVYCTAEDDIIRQRFYRDKEEYTKAGSIKMLLDRYEYFLKETKLKVHIYDTTKHG